MDVACCHGKRYDVIGVLKIELKRYLYFAYTMKMIFFFGIFHSLTKNYRNKKPFRTSLNRVSV